MQRIMTGSPSRSTSMGRSDGDCSAGISLPEDGPDVETLLKNADARWTRPREKDATTSSSINAEMNRQVNERLRRRRACAGAGAHEFELYYSPGSNVGSCPGGLRGLAALAASGRGLTLRRALLRACRETGLNRADREWC